MKMFVFAVTLFGALNALADPGAAEPGAAEPSADDGAKIWNDAKRAKCITCHGADGKGDTKMGKQKGVKDMTLPEWQTGHTDQQIIDGILKGVDREEAGKKLKMEPLKAGTADEAKALVAYIRTLGAKK